MSDSPSTDATASTAPFHRPLSIGTWNMDHWKRTPQQRRDAWSYLQSGSRADVMLLQECVLPPDLGRNRMVHREIAGSRPWGSAVTVLTDDLAVREIDTVRTRYASSRFSMLGSHPGSIIVARVDIPAIGPLTCVSVYGVINVYAQTTMLRIVADLIPLFDSADGERVVLGGDFNVGTSVPPSSPELPRYRAILQAVESLGLVNLAEVAPERPPPPEGCLCGQPACRHLHTFGENPGGQLDWLYATPELAARCSRLRVERQVIAQQLSDHAAVIADFDIPRREAGQSWDPDSFVREVAARSGQDSAVVAEDLVAWALRKHEELKASRGRGAALDRLPTSTGAKPELWVQLDLKSPEQLQYTFSLTAEGQVVVQFQYMTAPYDTAEARERLWTRLTEIEGLRLEKRLNGRPSFPMSTLIAPARRELFLRVYADVVEETRRNQRRAN